MDTFAANFVLMIDNSNTNQHQSGGNWTIFQRTACTTKPFVRLSRNLGLIREALAPHKTVVVINEIQKGR